MHKPSSLGCQLYTAINAFSCASLQHQARVGASRLSDPRIAPPRKTLHFGESNNKHWPLGVQVHPQPHNRLSVHLIVQVPAPARHVENQSKCQSNSVGSGHHVGLADDFIDVDVVHVLAQLHQVVPQSLALGFVERPADSQGTVHLTSTFEIFAQHSDPSALFGIAFPLTSLQHCTQPPYSAPDVSGNTTRTTRQVHVTTHRCVNWLNWGLPRQFQPASIQCSSSRSYVTCVRKIWMCIR